MTAIKDVTADATLVEPMTYAPLSSVGITRVTAAGESVGTVAFCVRDHLNASSVASLWATDWSWVPPGKAVQRVMVQGSVLTLQRNECVRAYEGDWLLFIDDDMTWKPDTIGRLVASWTEQQALMEEPLLMGGLCHRRSAPHDPTLYMRESPTSGGYRFLEDWATEIVEVDATGLAFLLIPTTAFEAIATMAGTTFPPYEERQRYAPPPMFRWDGVIGEDLRFCQDARRAGCRVAVDTRLHIGHVGEKTIGLEDYYREVALRSPTDEALVRRRNDTFGLPTLSATEAKRRLGW